MKSTLTTQFPALWQHRQLIARMAWRDILGRYRGSAGGLAWSLLTPILMLAVYTIVFSGIFKARWSADSTSPLDYALQLFVGLIIHGLAAECFNRAPVLVVSNVSYVKRVLFPLDTLPIVNLISALFHAAISVVVLLVFFATLEHHLYLTILWLPVVLLPYLVMLAGISWLLAALGVYLRDIAQLMGLVSMVLMFLSPVFYPISNLPARFHIFFQLNPLTVIIEQARAVILHGQAPDFTALGLYMLVAMAVACAGLAAFHKLKKGFADVL